MSKVQPPVLGFNNNVRHRGRIFHIQTEDSGVRSPRIVTHLFADGGQIIKTSRIDYHELLSDTDLPNTVRKLMKGQHKAMFLALRHGELDAALELACGPHPLPSALPSAAVLEAAALAPTVEHLAASSESVFSVPPAAGRSTAPPIVPSSMPAGSAAQGASRLTRPGLLASPSAKPARSIFGESAVSEKSLDEVILSYLAEDDDDA